VVENVLRGNVMKKSLTLLLLLLVFGCDGEKPSGGGDAVAVAALEKLDAIISRNIFGEVVEVNFDTPLRAFNEISITDAELVHLKGLTNLQEINLCRTQITDAGLVHLNGLVSLKRLYLIATQITDAGVKKLQHALPNCKIIH